MSVEADLRLAFRRMYLAIHDMVLQDVNERLGTTIQGGKLQSKWLSGVIPAATVPWSTATPAATAAAGAAGAAGTVNHSDHVHPQGVVTTKGDLLGYSTTAARHAVGSDGSVLTADSTQADGLNWKQSILVTGEIQGSDFKPSGLTGATAASRYAGATTSGHPTSGTFGVGDWVVDQTGSMWICTAAGTPGTWTQSGGASSHTHVIDEDHSSACNGSTTAFTLTNAYTAGTTVVTLNGLVQDPGGNDYAETTPASGTITFATAPSSGDVLLVSYLKAGAGGGGGGGSGNVTSTGAFGSEPASPASGDLYLPNNGYVIERYSGTAWEQWGPIFKFTPPVLANFAWTNQGTATATTTKGGIYLSAPANAGDSLRVLDMAAPATPYSITIAALQLGYAANYWSAGLVLRNSTSGSLVSHHVGYGPNYPLIVSNKWASTTSFSASYYMMDYGVPNLPLWLKLLDDGTNRIFYVSNDGQNWLQMFSVARTDYITPDRVGFFVDANNATYPAGMLLLSWAQGTS